MKMEDEELVSIALNGLCYLLVCKGNFEALFWAKLQSNTPKKCRRQGLVHSYARITVPCSLSTKLVGQLGAYLLKNKVSVEQLLRIVYQPQAIF